MTEYNHLEIEKKWQEYWEKEKLHRVSEDDPKTKKYILGMFPYPSGAGLHVGHPEGYTATDIMSRYLRMNGYKVLHPMGWDAFGLPAENYAIKQGIHPAKSTRDNINNFRRQIKSFGFSYDWDREIDTSRPEYYKWTQWLFLLLYKNGLAYKAKAPVNWCPSCSTVLAREQVVNGLCERCSSEVVQKEFEQWFFKITQYAQRLLDDLEKIDWPENIKTIQRNWIGRSEGALLEFEVYGHDLKIPTFTTRADTLEGATYIVLAPEHELVALLTTQEQNKAVKEYVDEVLKKTELQRTDLNKEKTGVFVGSYSINPLTKEKIPIWISDYVILGYGTGAIMAVPAHDERDREFALKFGLPIKEIELASADEVVKKVGGRKEVRYRLRDWLISRQRYWGAPIPIIYCGKCGMVPVPEQDLPVLLPEDVDFLPHGESPLASSESFHKVACPRCSSPAKRESDTMDTFVCSAWYYLRYCDPKNDQEAFQKDKVRHWMPVDIYIGGAEHAVMHLIYARFFTKVLRDLEYVDFDEPFLTLLNQGLILGEDNFKMSKSRGNVINPDDIIKEYGADTLRMYEMFMGPLEDSKPWNTLSIRGVRRFLDRVWSQADKIQDMEFKDLELLNQSIKKVEEDILRFSFNTAVSSLMILLRSIEKCPSGKAWDIFIRLLFPFAPHISEELWHRGGHEQSLTFERWPKADEQILSTALASWVVQVDGRTRAVFKLASSSGKEEILEQAKKDDNVNRHLKDKDIKDVVFVAGRLINILTK